MNKEYFEKIFSLYESVRDEREEEKAIQEEVEEELEKQKEEQLEQENEVEEGIEEVDNTEEVPEGMDTDYLDGEYSTYQQSEQQGRERIQKTNLFDLFRELRHNAETFCESIESIKVDKLDKGKIDRLNEYLKAIKNIIKKIDAYLEYNILEDDYEVIVYTYVNLRTEFVQALDLIQRTLRIKAYNIAKKD